MARKKPILAIAYDFDGTLAAGNMQEYDFIPDLGIAPAKFWAESTALAKAQDADAILAYMQLMLDKAKAKKVPVKKDSFKKFGSKITFFPGVENWFDNINAYGKEKGIVVQHFIISSGLREMIEGTKIAKKFERIYASGFMYDEHDVAYWPALAVNYTTKTQYLFRINKNSLDVCDNGLINKYVPESERPVPFSNMVFIGDGETDVPCMRMVKDKGGHSIAVYEKGGRGAKTRAEKLVTDGRVNIAITANYEENSSIDVAVKGVIDKIAANDKIYSA